MEDQDEKKKFRGTKQKTPVVNPQPYAPENKKISKDEFIKRRAASKRARLAADEAYKKSLASAGVSEETSAEDDELELAMAEVASIKEKIQETTDALSEEPDSKRLTNRLAKLQTKLTDAENSVEELEK